jgi:hypothetical protein
LYLPKHSEADFPQVMLGGFNSSMIGEFYASMWEFHTLDIFNTTVGFIQHCRVDFILAGQ